MQTETHTSLTTPSQDERIMAALAHAGVVIYLVGVIAPIIIWVTQREKSRYVAFQALQALAYQLILIFAWILGFGCYMAGVFGMVPFTAFLDNTGLSNGELFMLAPFFLICLLMLLGAVFLIYGLVGAFMTLQGRDFRYVILGPILERNLEQE